MQLQLRRIMLFSAKPKALAEFYQRAFGLEVVSDEESFVDLDAGAARVAIHKAAKALAGTHKVCFYVADVGAAVKHLVSVGAKMKTPQGRAGQLWFCDGEDPDGNTFQVSNRE